MYWALDYKSCVVDCERALELEPNYTKALHRRAKANVALENYSEAIKDFQQIIDVEPNNTEVRDYVSH
jgi:DnaJ family protein C protein 7